MAEEKGWLPSLGHASLGTKKLSSSQPTTSPYRRTLSRVCSNAWILIMASCMEATESYKPVTSLKPGSVCAEA